MANDFSGDANCVSLYRMEDAPPVTDTIGTNTLTVSGSPSRAAVNKEGDWSVSSGTNSNQLFRTDTNLSANFPGKSGTTNRTFSICAWVRYVTIVTGLQNVCSKYSTADSKRTFAVAAQDAKAQITIGYNSGASFELFADTSTTMVKSQWYHIGWTYDGTGKAWRIRIWDDTGSSVAETTGTGAETMNLEDTEFTVFARDDDIGGWLGYIDELVIFKDILSANEIDQIRGGIFGSVGATGRQLVNKGGGINSKLLVGRI